MDELNGYTAAIGSTTRETGDVIGNGLKSIFSRMTTAKPAIDSLQSIGVAIHDVQGNMKPVDQILGEVASKWSNLSKAQQENVGVNVASRYQLTRFLALMNNWQLATDATTTSINSQGSSMKEQAKYSDSLQARINRLSDAWSKFTLSMGKAFLTNGIVDAVESFNSLATNASKIIDKVGALGIVMGTLGTITLAVSDKFKAFSTAMIFGTTALNEEQLAITGITAGMTRAEAATAGFTMTLRGLGTASIVGVAFTVLGIAIEKVINAFADAKKAQEDFQQQEQKGIDALTTNKTQTEGLIKQYNDLTDAKKKAGSSWSVDQENQYLQTQQKLGDLYPQLISYIDGSGQAHLKNKDAINQELQATNALIDAKKLEQQVNGGKDIQSAINTKDELQKKIDELKQELKNPTTPLYTSDGTVFIKKSADDIKMLQSQLLMYQTQWSNAAQVVTSKVMTVADSYTKLQIDPNISGSVKEFFNSIDTSKLNSDQLAVFAMQIGKAEDALQKAYQKGDKNAFEEAQQSIADIASQMGASSAKVSTLSLDYDNLKKSQDASNKATYAGADGMNGIDTSATALDGTMTDLTGTVSQFAQQLSNAKGSFEDTKNVILDMVQAGETDAAITATQGQAYSALADEISPLNQLLEDMANGKSLSADEAMNLIAKEKDLAQYLSIENGQVKINQQGINDLRNAKLAAYQDMINAEKAQIGALDTGTQSALKSYGIQIKGILTVAQASQVLADLQAANAQRQAEINNSNSPGAMHASIINQNQYDQATSSINAIKSALSSLDGISGMASQGLTQVGTSASKAGDSTKSSTTVTDKYTQSLNSLNEQIQILENAQKNYAQGSASYRNALQQELSLQQQKLQLMQDQEKLLESQIKSGNVPVSSSGSSSSSSYATGSGTAAQVWNFLKSKGLSDAAVAGIMGNLQQESSMNPNSPGGGLAQWQGSRWSGLTSYAKSNGLSTNSLDAQLGYLWQEIVSGRQGVTVGGLNGMSSASAAAQYFSNNFERPGIPMMNNRTKYASQYYGQYSGGGSSSGGSVASAQSSLNQVQQNLIQLKQDISNQQTVVSDIRYQNIMQNVHAFDAQIATSEAKVKAMDRTSSAYRTELNNQYNLMMAQSKAYDSAAGKIIASEGKDSAHLQQLEADYTALHEKIAALNWEYYASEIDQYSASIDNLKSSIDQSQKVMELNAGNMKVQASETTKQIELNNQIISQLDAQKAVMERALKNGYLDAAQKADMTKQLVALNQQYIEYQINIKNATDALNQQIQTQAQNINSAVDQMIQAYKDAYEEKRKIALNELDQEYSDLEKATQKKLALIDQTENQNTYNKDLSQKQSDISTLQAQINAFSLDPTQAGKVADMRKQLAQQQLDLQDYIHQHDIQAQKDSLNQQLSDQKDAIDNQKNQVNAYYDSLVNDETKFALWRKEMLAGNTQDVLNQLGTVKDWILKNMPEIGQVIANNLTLEIDKATQAIKDAGTAAKSMQLGYSMTIADKARLGLASLKNTSKVDHVTILQDTPLLTKTADGLFEYTGNILKKGMVYKAYGVDYADGMFAVGGSNYVTADPSKTKYQFFDTGGYTKDSQGLAYLHEKEIVLNKMDTSNFLKAIDITRSIAKFLPKFDIPKLATSTNNQNVNIDMNINIENLQGGKEGADSFFKEINTRLRGKGGVLRFD